MKQGVFILFLVVGLASCNLIDMTRIRGNGTIASKEYQLKEFKGIDISGDKSLYIKQDSTLRVRVETDENILNLLDVRVANGVLSVSVKGGYWIDPSDEIKVYVSMPLLKTLTVSGASEVESDGRFSQNEKLSVKLSGASEGTLNFRAPDIDATVSGASTATIQGESRNVIASVSGASTLEGFDLKTENNSVEASGASTANVFASVSLKGNASGASKINYRGNPKVSQKISGAGSIKKLGEQ